LAFAALIASTNVQIPSVASLFAVVVTVIVPAAAIADHNVAVVAATVMTARRTLLERSKLVFVCMCLLVSVPWMSRRERSVGDERTNTERRGDSIAAFLKLLIA